MSFYTTQSRFAPLPHLCSTQHPTYMVENSFWLVLNSLTICFFPHSWLFSLFKNISLLAPELDTPVFVILVLTTWIPSVGGSLFLCAN